MEKAYPNQTNKIYKICFTGGPCAGKTTSMAHIKEKLGSHFMVYTLPELAATTFGSGVTIVPHEFTEDTHVVFTGGIMQMQIQMEDYFTQIAAIQKKDVVILTDRGVMDNTAYCSKQTEAKVYEKHGWNKTDIRDNRYDMVIHLVTAADGAEKYYTLENNQARSETPEVARELDRKTQAVWNGHPNHVIVDNHLSSFEEKVDRVYKNLCQVLGIEAIPTYNRKFALKAPINIDDIPDVYLPEEFEETLVYLRNSEPNHLTWVKSRKADNGMVHLSYIDRTIAEKESERIELKRRVSPELFTEYCKLRDPERHELTKKIVQFTYNNKRFTAETLNTKNDIVYTCRVFVDEPTEEISFPDFAQVGDEVTEDPKFFTHIIANGAQTD